MQSLYDLQSQEILWGSDASGLEWFAGLHMDEGSLDIVFDVWMLVLDGSPTWVFLVGYDLSESACLFLFFIFLFVFSLFFFLF